MFLHASCDIFRKGFVELCFFFYIYNYYESDREFGWLERDLGLNFESFILLLMGVKWWILSPSGTDLLISEGESVQLDQPLTSNPNVGGFACIKI